MKTKTMMQTWALSLALIVSQAMAAVTPEEAAKLGSSLTPLGAQKEGNAEGSIPAWTGGLKQDAAPVTNLFVGDPFAGEKPLFTITAANVGQYKARLSEGQVAMFKRYPDTYKIPVYASHRTAANPQNVYDAAKKSALNTQPADGGNGLLNFADSRYYAFPIPKSGVEVLWNHLTRYRGLNQKRETVQAVPQVNGSFTIVQLNDEIAYPQFMPADAQADATNILFYYKQEVTAPPRLAGSVTLIHETIDQVKEPRLAWVYSAGQRRVRRAPQVAYDGPGTASDGMRTTDNGDLFNGSPDRYDWKLIGKKEMYIPYNNYRLASPSLKYADILKPGHINQDLTRYELHRVWEVEATLKPGMRNIYAKRHMYIDEDTWQAALIDHYDGRGQLWRVAEGMAYNDYANGVSTYAAQALYDLIAGRYLVNALMNESRHGSIYGNAANLADYTPAALRSAGIR